MTERLATAEAHAYVDNCLSPQERGAFEARLAGDPALRRRVELWQAQNEAIRAAYGALSRTIDALALSGPADQNPTSWLPPQIASRRAVEAFSREPQLGDASNRPGFVRRGARPRERAKSAPRFRLGVVLGLALGLIILTSGGGPTDPRGALGDAGVAAFRAFGVDANVPFDYSSRDPQALARWLSPRFFPSATLASLNVAGWTPVGARIVPGTASAAAFIVWENHDRMRAGMLVESYDGSAPYAARSREVGGLATAAWTQGGQGFAAVASDSNAVVALTRMGADFGEAGPARP